MWNYCQSFGWLYLAVLNVVKLFCSLFLLWHKWQCIASVNNRVLVWFNWLLNRLLSATHMGKDREVAVEVSVFHLPCPPLHFHTCEPEIEHFIWHIHLQIKFMVKLNKKWLFNKTRFFVSEQKYPWVNWCFSKKIWMNRERLKLHFSHFLCTLIN